MIFTIVKLIIYIVIIASVLGLARTWQMEHSLDQEKFIAGKVPSTLPDGLYKGVVPGHKFSWLGKKFDISASTGINLFEEGSTTIEKYPFKTSITKGIRDKNIDVIRIDYNISSNPFWLRSILDEIVEVAPEEYLGKLHIHIFGFTITLGYFELKK